jgi:O-glycosyl hydrolase
MDTGLNSGNTRKYIDVTTLSKNIGTMCDVLPALHAFSGFVYTCSFMRKGKVKFHSKIVL